MYVSYKKLIDAFGLDVAELKSMFGNIHARMNQTLAPNEKMQVLIMEAAESRNRRGARYMDAEIKLLPREDIHRRRTAVGYVEDNFWLGLLMALEDCPPKKVRTFVRRYFDEKVTNVAKGYLSFAEAENEKRMILKLIDEIGEKLGLSTGLAK